MAGIDLEKFRLRRFVDHLISIGEVDIHDRPIALADISAVIEASPKATLFKNAGPERFEVVGAVGGSRRRHAAAFGTTDERNLAQEFARRMANPQPVVEVPQADAPAQQVVIAGDDVDLTRLPFHMQHTYDGAPYLSSAIDYTVDPATGRRNVGCRRLMLRGRNTMLSNLTQVSDLKRMFLACVERGEHLHLNFAVGAHPLDFVAACVRATGDDEFATVAALRGAPLPVTRGVSNGLPVPADAELVIEGYFDKAGYTEIEGPYGEFLGYYGPAHIDPVFHVTAITMRKDVLHQTVLHGTVKIARSDHAHQSSILTEARIRQVLSAAGIDPVAVYAVPSASGLLHARVSVRRDTPGQARAVIAALFAIPFLKHVYVLDEEVDIFSRRGGGVGDGQSLPRRPRPRHRTRTDGVPDGRHHERGPHHHQGWLRYDRPDLAHWRRSDHHARAAHRRLAALPDRRAGAWRASHAFRRADGRARQQGRPRDRDGARPPAPAGRAVAQQGRRVGVEVGHPRPGRV